VVWIKNNHEDKRKLNFACSKLRIAILSHKPVDICGDWIALQVKGQVEEIAELSQLDFIRQDGEFAPTIPLSATIPGYAKGNMFAPLHMSRRQSLLSQRISAREGQERARQGRGNENSPCKTLQTPIGTFPPTNKKEGVPSVYGMINTNARRARTRQKQLARAYGHGQLNAHCLDYAIAKR
jgi:hypothetical protein